MLRCTLRAPRSCLRHLTELHCHNVELDLTALAEFSPQLRSVFLLRCRLNSGSAPGEGTSVFAEGWGSLQKLLLTGSYLDTTILAADFPQLTVLHISNLTLEDDGTESLNALAAGCVATTCLEFAPTLTCQHAPYMAFPALKRLNLKLDPLVLPAMMGRAWHEQAFDVPTSLTALELTSANATDVGDLYCAPERCMDLRAALCVAVACIRGGAPLRSLTLAQCMTACSNEDVIMGPAFPGVQELYETLGGALRGVTRLDLRASPYIGHPALDYLIYYAPDLRRLELGEALRDGRRWGETGICCHGLHEVDVWYQLTPAAPGKRGLDYYFQLDSVLDLRKFSIRLLNATTNNYRAGDRLTVVLDDTVTAQLLVFVEAAEGGGWELGFNVQAHKQAHLKSLVVSYVYDHGANTWTSGLWEDEG